MGTVSDWFRKPKEGKDGSKNTRKKSIHDALYNGYSDEGLRLDYLNPDIMEKILQDLDSD
jgi:hypothetical protein